MRPKLILPALLASAASAASLAQDSICNPCVDPPTQRNRTPFGSPDGTPVIRREDLRRLGVIDVADLIDGAEAAGMSGLDRAAERQLDVARVRLQANGSCPRTTGSTSVLRTEGATGTWYGSSDLAVQLPEAESTDSEQTLVWSGSAADAAAGAMLEVAVHRVDHGGASAAAAAVSLEPDTDAARWYAVVALPEAGCWLVTGGLDEHYLSIVIESTVE